MKQWLSFSWVKLLCAVVDVMQTSQDVLAEWMSLSADDDRLLAVPRSTSSTELLVIYLFLWLFNIRCFMFNYWPPMKRVVYSFSPVSMSVCQTITFERVDVGSSLSHTGSTGPVHIWRSSGQRQGDRSQRGRKFLFAQCKTLIGNNSHSIKHRAMKLVYSIGFPSWWIECCDCHVCHVTRGERA